MPELPERITERVPKFAYNYPARAETLEQARLPFYCCNCSRKGPTKWVTANFGPFCDDCLDELRPYLTPGMARQLAR